MEGGDTADVSTSGFGQCVDGASMPWPRRQEGR